MNTIASFGRIGLLPVALLALGLAGCFEEPIDCGDCNDDTEAPPPPELELSVDALDFGDLLVGEDYQESLGVGNQGGSDLVITGIAASAPFVAHDTEVTVATSSSVLLYVQITPTEPAELSGTLSFRWNDPQADAEGTLVEIPITASVPEPDTGDP